MYRGLPQAYVTMSPWLTTSTDILGHDLAHSLPLSVSRSMITSHRFELEETSF
jgi:hypothetical protein